MCAKIYFKIKYRTKCTREKLYNAYLSDWTYTQVYAGQIFNREDIIENIFCFYVRKRLPPLNPRTVPQLTFSRLQGTTLLIISRIFG